MHHLDETRRQLRPQLGERLHVVGLDDLHDLALDRRADAGEPGGLPFNRELRHRNRGVPDPSRRTPVGGQSERVGAVELQHVGQKLEALGEFGIRRQLRGHGGDDTRVRLVVCVPTYDERENLDPMVRALGAVLDGLELSARVLVIDDASPDGTGRLADRLAGEVDFLDVLHRERKEGLGPAYVAAFERALATDAKLVATMDCDFSHEPSDLPRLVEATSRAGSRSVLGTSRAAGRRTGALCDGSSAARAPRTPVPCSASP